MNADQAIIDLARAVGELSSRVSDLGVAVGELSPLAKATAIQAVKTEAIERAQKVQWTLIGDHAKKHQRWDRLAYAVFVVGSLLSAAVGGGTYLIIDFGKSLVNDVKANTIANSVQDTQLGQLIADRQIVTIVSGNTPEAQKAIKQIQSLTSRVKDMQADQKEDHPVTIQQTIVRPLKAPQNVEDKPRRPAR